MDTATAQQNAIQLAALQVEVAHLKLAVADLRATNAQQNEKMDKQNEKLDKVLQQLAEARGGWRTLMLIGGAAGTLGAGLQSLLSHWRP